ncbi:hypothetical protein [Xenorhabdus bovienii]|uniref:hypothetical protein n=1 Tax=Xenorhabdus bovienii TaxID=40576 RepID=UPI00237C8E59|nr:hypothetical protein [Xenorhabdus bovienii]MDE1482162.1 hypothetical protein [Xenorhabdus bovienii]MDE9465618.1 hypothetical protein [Xenorhabdus bovienii]
MKDKEKHLVPHSLKHRYVNGDGYIDIFSDSPIQKRSKDKKNQRNQHNHPLPETIEELFASFLLPATPCQQHYLDYNLWRSWRVIWSYHKQKYRREAILNGTTLKDYLKDNKLPRQRAYFNLRKAGGASIKVLFWVYHRRQYYQNNQHNQHMSVKDYIIANNITHKSAMRQLSRRMMSKFWAEHYENYYANFWPAGFTVSAYARHYDLSETTARQYLFAFPRGLFSPSLIKDWM